MAREVINVPGLIHKAPSPMGVKIGNMVFSGGIYGCDTETQEVPKDNPEKQAQLLFENIRKFMECAGGSVDDIGHVELFVKDDSYRKYINPEWIKMFPDENDRPTRHAIVTEMRGSMLIQAELTAVLTN